MTMTIFLSGTSREKALGWERVMRAALEGVLGPVFMFVPLVYVVRCNTRF